MVIKMIIKNKINRPVKILLVSFIFLIFLIIISLAFGTMYIEPTEVIKVLLNRSSKETYMIIINQIRLPRILLGLMVGSGLATAGVIFQGIIRNPMVDPYVVGVSSGAGTGVTLGIVLSIDLIFFGINTLPLLAFLGGITTVFIVYNLARVGKKLPVLTFLLAGVAMGFLLNAVMSFLMVMGTDSLHKVIYWLMGSLASAGWQDIFMILPYFLLSIIPILYYIKDLNIILLGEDSARSLGVNVERVKIVLITAATFLTAIVVSVSGIIGFVGLIIPHVCRMLIGPDHRKLLPLSALVGAAFLLMSDNIARTLLAPLEIPVGIITAIFGAPYFIYLLKKKKNEYW